MHVCFMHTRTKAENLSWKYAQCVVQSEFVRGKFQSFLKVFENIGFGYRKRAWGKGENIANYQSE